MVAAARRDESDRSRAREEILSILERTVRVDLGSIYSMIQDVMGPGHEMLVAELVSSLSRQGVLAVETGTRGPDRKGPLVAWLRLTAPVPAMPPAAEMSALTVLH